MQEEYAIGCKVLADLSLALQLYWFKVDPDDHNENLARWKQIRPMISTLIDDITGSNTLDQNHKEILRVSKDKTGKTDPFWATRNSPSTASIVDYTATAPIERNFPHPARKFSQRCWVCPTLLVWNTHVCLDGKGKGQGTPQKSQAILFHLLENMSWCFLVEFLDKQGSSALGSIWRPVLWHVFPVA